uniref:class I SAM-dependent methyltransferase n=1 Tax=uncultured Draconibacterium sp. TaxID=1573823 RepID=UPI0032172DC3
MRLKNISKQTSKPALYEKGTAVMWTDEHISKQLLQVHLNTEIDLASRKMETINKTTEWILNKMPGQKLDVLDLGCGPGLYCELLAGKGHSVTGVDFSKSSVNYAKEQAEKKKLKVEYIQANYLELELPENSYDLVIMIFTDMGVLSPAEREKMIRFVHKILKPGGTFIFDICNDKEVEKKLSPKNWEVAEEGFWKPEPYLALSESFLYEKEKVILFQHILLNEKDEVDVYRFWTHFFSHADLGKLLKTNGFYQFDFYENILPEGGLWNGGHVTFTVARK